MLFLSLLLLLVTAPRALPAAIFLQKGDISQQGFGVDGVATEKKDPELSGIVDAYNRGDYNRASERARHLAGTPILGRADRCVHGP